MGCCAPPTLQQEVPLPFLGGGGIGGLRRLRNPRMGLIGRGVVCDARGCGKPLLFVIAWGPPAGRVCAVCK